MVGDDQDLPRGKYNGIRRHAPDGYIGKTKSMTSDRTRLTTRLHADAIAKCGPSALVIRRGAGAARYDDNEQIAVAQSSLRIRVYRLKCHLSRSVYQNTYCSTLQPTSPSDGFQCTPLSSSLRSAKTTLPPELPSPPMRTAAALHDTFGPSSDPPRFLHSVTAPLPSRAILGKSARPSASIFTNAIQLRRPDMPVPAIWSCAIQTR